MFLDYSRKIIEYPCVSDGHGSKPLTPRQLEILQLCAEGFSDREIAKALGISVFTVGNHIRQVLRKTGSANRTEAVGNAFRDGLLSSDAVRASVREEIEAAATPEPKDPADTIPALIALPRKKESQVPGLDRHALRLIGALQQVLAHPESLPDLLGLFGRTFSSHIPMITWATPPGEDFISVTTAPAMGEDWQRRYDEYYAGENPLLPLVFSWPGDFFAVTEDYPMPPSFYRHPFYTEYCRTLDIVKALTWTVFPHDRWGVQLFLAQSPSPGPVSPADRELGILLFPHVRYTLTRLWERSAESAAASELGASRVQPFRTDHGLNGHRPLGMAETEAWFLLDSRGRLLLASSPGETMLQSGECLSLRHGMLRPLDPGQREQLSAAVSAAIAAAEGNRYAGPVSFPLRCNDPNTAVLTVSVIPLMPAGNPAPGPVERARVIVTVQSSVAGERHHLPGT